MRTGRGYSTSWTWNGSSFDPCDAVPIADRGFRYGMAVFESFPVISRVPLFLSEHDARLRQACAQAGLRAALPSFSDFQALLRAVPFDAFARIYVTAGDGTISDGTENGRVFVFVEPLTASPSPEAYRLSIHRAPFTPIFAGLKTANYWPNLIALQQTRSAGADEALLFDAAGSLISACMANVFVVCDGILKTPPASTGARSGVIRQWVMQRRPAQECRITENDLASATEIFLTNSRIGIMPVASIENRPLPSPAISSQLRVEYQREIGDIAAGG